MASLREEAARLQFLVEKGHGEEKVHVIFIEREAAERIANERKGIQKPKTKFVMETDSADMYRRFNFQKDRWLRLIRNKSVALDLLCRIWEEIPDATIQALADDEPETIPEMGS